ncbi:unnamed protein product [Rotaria socialis]|uniref:NAD(P)(+)--arginine ADP-ribosyltransferase n=1 Tax=Rotaria socialis TaxID=392032 RepID=A0A821KMY9_9BILA|nr:unnamed protein product [Rotaria socialis]CAF4738140.1 unnamed protein product [Rotaria socialis]
MDEKEVNCTSQCSKQTSIADEISVCTRVQKQNISIRDSHLSCQNRIIENFMIIWLDPNLNQSDEQTRTVIMHLRCIVNCVEIFADFDRCINHITEIKDEEFFLIVSGLLDDHIILLISEMTHFLAIYLLRHSNQSDYERLAQQCNKVKGNFTCIESLCDALKKDVHHFEKDLTPISTITFSSINNMNELEPSFMYSQLLKEILLEREYEDKDKTDFVQFCRLFYDNNRHELPTIEEFERNYTPKSSIWWYTRGCFIYAMINKALRTQNIHVIMKMGFFVRDLHRQIEVFYRHANHCSPFAVYRGQGLLHSEFVKMKKNKNGLVSFNNFLSTSTDRQVAYLYADSAAQNPNIMGILFRVEIDPSISTVPFTSLNNISYFGDTEKEILFSMHTIFRMISIEQIENRLWQINLMLTDDNDQQLILLKENIGKVTQGPTWLHRMAQLMYYMGEFDKAAETFTSLLETTSLDDCQLVAEIHHQLGYINEKKDNLVAAFSHYQQSFDIFSTHLLPNDPRLAVAYTAIGTVRQKQGDTKEAVKYLQKALEIDSIALASDSVTIATRYNNIGLLLKEQGKTEEALTNFEHALGIYLAHLPPRHPSLATIYNNIGLVHRSMGENSKALNYYEKTLDVRQKSLPPNHPLLAQIHGNIACVLDDLRQTKSAIEHLERAVDINCAAFGSDHPHVQAYQILVERFRSKLASISDVDNSK